MRNVPIQVLSGVDTANVTGGAFFVGQCVAASFVASFADTSADGTVKIQGSNDSSVSPPNPNNFTPTNWADIPSATSTITNGVGSAIVLPTMNFQYIRAAYTSASGGSTTIVVNMTGLSV